MEILQNPVVVAVLALVGLPAVASAITALLRKMAGDGVKPEAVLYVVSAALTAVAMFATGAHLPGIDPANPLATVGEWQVFTAGFMLYTAALYDVLLKRFWGAPTPEPTPPPPSLSSGRPGGL